ncbi:MAG: poly(R)-hydroxyalkanoic acid synthase subunit PhaE [Candidatus Competibacteraceae bacterium]|nr:poly(R)-hydroxyalkanoic acid synthase subunit PhaE [Candidatus Competibacteraceae bacterium]
MPEQDPPAGLDPAATEWDQARQSYWQTWMDLARRGLDVKAPLEETAALDEWVETLRRWWEMTTPKLLRSDPELFYKLLAQGLGYLVFSERALHLIRALEEAAREEQDWNSSLSRGLETVRATLIDPSEGSPSGLATCWGLPLGTWTRVVAELAPSRLPHSPEDDPRAFQLWQAYREARQEYARLLRQAAQQALTDLQLRLQRRAEVGNPVTTLRGFYNLWVESSEAAYDQTLRSAEYGQAFGRLINTLLHLKAHSRRQTEADLRRLNIPTHSELEDAHARVAALHRRLRHLENRHTLTDLLAGLRQEIEQLRQDMEQLKGRCAPAPPQADPDDGTQEQSE